ncbi:protein croquemort-like [Planococcus citri]|uniref:protein croquemort-like n=1 Tax=Planococcus citri TaxID=170843 RepID=UPI0031FA14F1
MINIITYLFYGCGSFFLVLGLAISGFWEPLFHNILANQLVLTKDSQTGEVWSQNSVPIYFKVYMFNWTNPTQTLARKQKANFAEVGPYTFRFSQIKSNVIWNQNGTVSFRVDRLWSFVPEKSNGNLTDHITNINAVAISLGERVKDTLWIKKFLWSAFLDILEKQLYVTKTVEELLFKGYRDEVLDIGRFAKKYLAMDFGYLPEKFGWYFRKNATEKNTFNMFTGAEDINKLGLVHSWNFKTDSGVYSDHCDQVRGSLGELWPKNSAEKDSVSLFISDFCGSFELEKSGTQIVHGVEGVQFTGTAKTFNNTNKRAKNRCYCKNSKCTLPSGVRDVSNCVHGPVYVSFPHFYLANDIYRRAIKGMKPDPEKHKFSITMQKESGILTEIFARFQINIKVEPYPGIGFFSNLPRMMVPTVWFEEYIELPENLQNRMKLAFNLAPNLLSTFGFIFIILGSVLLNCGYIYTQMYVISVDPAPISNMIL